MNPERTLNHDGIIILFTDNLSALRFIHGFRNDTAACILAEQREAVIQFFDGFASRRRRLDCAQFILAVFTQSVESADSSACCCGLVWFQAENAFTAERKDAIQGVGSRFPDFSMFKPSGLSV